IVDFSTGSKDNLADMVGHPNLEIRDGSITDPALLEAAVVGVDAVYHLAAAV
ncbi:MAG TPA: nucleoside-diphosphate sugar epimerase, partial [Planctomycetaceae bacterium]|nr:nucleoside-diphosphate sugar epimerase [Planctomycetaceae bacterium]